MSVSRRNFERLGPFLFTAILFAVSAAHYWHGFGPTGDAERYVAAAMRWYDDGRTLGETHWALRHLFVIPMAASFALFGPGEFAATVPNIAYAAGLTFLTFYLLRRYVGALEGAIGAFLIATSAFFVARPMEIGVYGAEIFFVAASGWLFVAAQNERRRMLLLFCAGAASGLAWTLREQSVAFMAGLGVIALLSRRQPFLSCLALGLGFASILAVELVAYSIAAGNPLYRYEIDLNHRAVGWKAIDPVADPLGRKLFRPFHDILTDPITTPVIVLTAILSVIGGIQRLAEVESKKRALLAFAVASVISMLVSAYVFNLALPRYYPALVYFFALLGAAAIATLWRRGSKAMAVLSLAAILSLNVVGEEFSNYNEYTEARQLVRIVEQLQEPVFTDPLSGSRARHLLRMSKMPDEEIARRVRSGEPAPPGVLFFKAFSVKEPPAYLCVIERKSVRPHNWAHAFLRDTGIADRAGNQIRAITAAPRPVEFGRVVSGPAKIDPVSGKPCI